MNLKTTLTLAPLLSLAVLGLSSCQAVVQSMWTPRTSLPGEQRIQTPATIVSASRGLSLMNSGSVHVSSTFCKFCTDAGKTYRGDMMPIIVTQPAAGGSFLGSARELPFRVGQKGLLTVGSQSGVVHSFMPYEYGGKIAESAHSASR